ncbi:hypothetical protein H4S01_005233, partial [Coemansia sp. RSA 2610]
NGFQNGQGGYQTGQNGFQNGQGSQQQGNQGTMNGGYSYQSYYSQQPVSQQQPAVTETVVSVQYATQTQVADVQITETIHSADYATTTVVSDYAYNLQPVYTSVAPGAQNFYAATPEVSYVYVPYTVTVTEQGADAASPTATMVASESESESSSDPVVNKAARPYQDKVEMDSVMSMSG